MNRIPALKIVQELARQNAIDLEDAEDMDKVDEYKKQQEAMDKVDDIIAGFHLMADKL